MSPASTLLAALAAAVILAPASAAGQTPDVGILEVSVDPAFPAAFGQELRLRVRIANRGSASAKGVALDAKAGASLVGHFDVPDPMRPSEQRTITLLTHFRPSGAECISVVPVVAADSPVKAGPARLVCLTPGCYSISERPAN
jgi:hypothetical protein